MDMTSYDIMLDQNKNKTDHGQTLLHGNNATLQHQTLGSCQSEMAQAWPNFAEYVYNYYTIVVV